MTNEFLYVETTIPPGQTIKQYRQARIEKNVYKTGVAITLLAGLRALQFYKKNPLG